MNCSTFWAAAVTFTEEAAERTRSSFALHWKASQSARAFADNPKALPRTFGSLGKFFFFFLFLCNTYMPTAALGTTSAQRLLVIICLHQASSQVGCRIQ